MNVRSEDINKINSRFISKKPQNHEKKKYTFLLSTKLEHFLKFTLIN